MRADKFVAAGHKARNPCNAVAARPGPIGVDGVFERALRQSPTSGVGRDTNRLRDLHKHVDAADVPCVAKVCFVERVPNIVETFSQFLSETTVVGVRALIELQSFRIHQPFEARMNGLDIDRPACKQVFERKSLRRGVRVQRKKNPFHVDIQGLPDLLNARSTEVTPGADKVGKYFQSDLWHEVR